MPAPEAPGATNRIVSRDPSARYARVGDRSITAGQFAADIAACAEQLPPCRHVINLCADRYHFGVVFFAALVRGQVNLLPLRRDAAALASLQRQYPHSAIVTDRSATGGDALVDMVPGTHGTAVSPAINEDELAAIVFTSGSTGASQPHEKTWGLLSHFRAIHWRCLARALRVSRLPANELSLVATVPPWHMYGLEWSLLLPTAAPITLHCGADFFPSDVCSGLDRFDTPTVLVSTPTHLQALLKGPPPAKRVGIALSATAPLGAALASDVERRLGARILEIYGCSEIGSLASRHPIRAPAWEFFDCFDLMFDAGELTVSTPLLPGPVTLADRFGRVAHGRFELHGRATDIVKVGGKRESLANLNAALLAIPGVEDGLVYQPERFGFSETGRLAALVVAPALDVRSIRTQLADKLEPAFVPRPIRRVAALPRDETSKLSMDALRVLLAGDFKRNNG